MTKSSLTKNQQQVVLKRSALYKTGKAKVYTLAEARRKLKKRLRK